MTKPFTFDGQTMTRAQWAETLGIAVPAFARRVRRYEAGLMSLAEVMTPGALPGKVPEPYRAPEDVLKRRLVAALKRHQGNGATVAEKWGESRQWVNTLVHRYGLVEFARALRKERASTASGG